MKLKNSIILMLNNITNSKRNFMVLFSIPPGKLKYLVMLVGFTIMCIGCAMK